MTDCVVCLDQPSCLSWGSESKPWWAGLLLGGVQSKRVKQTMKPRVWSHAILADIVTGKWVRVFFGYFDCYSPYTESVHTIAKSSILRAVWHVFYDTKIWEISEINWFVKVNCTWNKNKHGYFNSESIHFLETSGPWLTFAAILFFYCSLLLTDGIVKCLKAPINFLGTPVHMHGGLLCIAFCLSVCL